MSPGGSVDLNPSGIARHSDSIPGDRSFGFVCRKVFISRWRRSVSDCFVHMVDPLP